MAEMPLSPQSLMENLIETGGQAGVPLGRLPSPEQLKLSTVNEGAVGSTNFFVSRASFLCCADLITLDRSGGSNVNIPNVPNRHKVPAAAPIEEN